MKVEKKVISHLNKCYSMSELNYRGERCFLVAAEKRDPCYLFSEDGVQLETVWTEPGGVMTMAQVPGSDGQFLATHQFYSPNDSKDAKIIIATPRGKDDWRSPGACFAAVLPEDLSGFDGDHPLPLTKIKDNLLKNHGYSAIRVDGHDAAVVGCEEGTFLFIPPASPDQPWEIRHLCGVPASDSVLVDFDGDGQLELGTISPFHGNSITIYHLDAHGNYVPQWKYPCPESETEMVHATWAGTLLGRPAWVVGWRKGTKNTIAITYENGAYQTAFIDQNTGCANLMHFAGRDGKDVLVATNREIDEAAMYTITE